MNYKTPLQLCAKILNKKRGDLNENVVRNNCVFVGRAFRYQDTGAKQTLPHITD